MSTILARDRLRKIALQQDNIQDIQDQHMNDNFSFLKLTWAKEVCVIGAGGGR